ncbi:MAG: MarR family transcriptional regulator [Hyphomicrobiales bacterium]|nr:MarR family transcriptional regulator [Hyphomicrobiales bacterium]
MTQQTDALRVWFRMMRLNTRIRNAMSSRLRTLDLSLPQCDVLTTLTEQEGISQQELAKRLYVTKGNISGLIDRLTEAGFVERRTIDGDKRSHALYLTRAGHSMAQQGIAAQQAYVAETFGRLEMPQLRDFDDLLKLTRSFVRAIALRDNPEEG